ncbi:hypothetical protein [Enterococcus devriesei]|uniref:hypothetical protein n=1 Tax=Enterococcus devriesei TaxID=319970 RepID=UPI0008FFF97F
MIGTNFNPKQLQFISQTEAVFFDYEESIKFSYEQIALQQAYSCPASQTSFIGNKQNNLEI